MLPSTLPLSSMTCLPPPHRLRAVKQGLQDHLIKEFNYCQGIARGGGESLARTYYVGSFFAPLLLLLIFMQYTDITPKLQFVPLHLKQMCPQKLLLLRRDIESGKYRSYIACKDGLFRETDHRNDMNASPFLDFEHETTRSEDERLNIWLIILNAEAKFSCYIEKYGLESLPLDVQRIIKETLEIVALIYKELETSPTLLSDGDPVKYPGANAKTEAEGPSRNVGIAGRQSTAPNHAWCADHGFDRWSDDLANHPNRPSSASISSSVEVNLIIITQLGSYIANYLMKKLKRCLRTCFFQYTRRMNKHEVNIFPLFFKGLKPPQTRVI